MWQSIQRLFQGWRDQLRYSWRDGRYPPEKLALTLALGVTLSIIPLVGFSTLLLLGLAAVMRLPVGPAIAISYLIYPLQFFLLYPYAYLGAQWFGWTSLAEAKALVGELAAFHWSFLLSHAGNLLAQALLAWFITSIPLFALLYYTVLYLFDLRNRNDWWFQQR